MTPAQRNVISVTCYVLALIFIILLIIGILNDNPAFIIPAFLASSVPVILVSIGLLIKKGEKN